MIAGATSGGMPPAELQRIFYQQLAVIGSTGSTLDEFEALLRMLESTGVRPRIQVIGFDDIPDGFQRLLDGEVRGKLVVDFDR